MTERHGLTLLEVLLATALLALLAATTTPLIVQTRHALTQEPAVDWQNQLQDFADELLSDPTAFGVEDLQQIHRVELSWPEEPSRPPISIQRLEPADTTVKYIWLVFQCEQSFVVRRLLRPVDREPQT